MPTFTYIGRNAQGKQVKGNLNGSNESAIVQQLNNQQITPVAIKVKEEKKSSNVGDINISDLPVSYTHLTLPTKA